MNFIKELIIDIIDVFITLFLLGATVPEPWYPHYCHRCGTAMEWDDHMRYDYCPDCNVYWSDLLDPLDPETFEVIRINHT